MDVLAGSISSYVFTMLHGGTSSSITANAGVLSFPGAVRWRREEGRKPRTKSLTNYIVMPCPTT
ncbi:MAG TPA: hypothetical protein VJP07_09100 [Dehalococcoidia bacterium]|nr:hypothetical protein [Dehalococcoidia bacterium]